jgi:O-antigen/teichoic acid export membrane protein
MFLLQMAVMVMFQCDKVIIGVVVSPAAVTPYALLGQLFVVAYGLLMIVLGPLVPAYGEAFRRRDTPWIRRHLRLSLLAGFGLVGGCGAVLLLFGHQVFGRWTHGQVTGVPRTLTLAMTAMFLLRVWVDCRSAILNPANVLRPQVRFFMAHLVLNAILALALAKPFGVAGVAWATPIAGLMSTAWGYPWLLAKVLRENSPATAASNPQAPEVPGLPRG